MTFLRNFWNDEQGQDLIEYTLLMAFVALGFGSAVPGRRRQHQGHLVRHEQPARGCQLAVSQLVGRAGHALRRPWGIACPA